MKFVPAWVWDQQTDQFIRSTVKETPLLHAGCGASTFGDIRIDKFKTDAFFPIDARADWNALPFKDDAFGAVIMDPPWKVAAMLEIATAYKEALRVAPILYSYAPFLWKSQNVEVEAIWVRVAPGVHHPVMLTKYVRNGRSQPPSSNSCMKDADSDDRQNRTVATGSVPNRVVVR